MKTLLLATLLIFNGMDLHAHSGRTDSKGGHRNSKTGTYHYHGGGPPKSTPPEITPSKSIEGLRIIELGQQINKLEKRMNKLEKRIRELEKLLNEIEKPIVKPDKSSTVQPKPTDQDDENITVYGTQTGRKYHRAGCRYLSKSQMPYSLKIAKALYSPCSVCNPPR